MPDTGLAAPDSAPRPRDAAPARARAALAGRAVDSLLDGSCLTSALPSVAGLLHLPVGGRYVVVALAGGSAPRRAAARARWCDAGPRALWRVGPLVEHAIVLLDPAARGPRTAPGQPRGVRAGVSLPVRGLAAIAEARGRADEALARCQAAGGRAPLAEHLSAALVQSDPQLADALSALVLGPVLGEDDTAAEPDAELLLDTFVAWVAAGGSVRAAATELGCHRNTVTNRLRRLERRTGRRVDRPDDLVDLVLSLQVRALGRARRPRRRARVTPGAAFPPA